MSSVKLKISGNIIEELSQKIPSSLFALNEIIKNSYDAFSQDISIEICSINNTIKISDHGIGMGDEEINSLFHISKSTKKYGQEVKKNGLTRITQGSKGLGFLSVFKFGDKVEWATCKAGVRKKFSVYKSELVAKEDVVGTAISVSTDTHDENGTIITIHSTRSEIENLLSEFSDHKILEKLVASIHDSNFNIIVSLGAQGEKISTKDLKKFDREMEGSQLLYILYDSKTNRVVVFNKGKEVSSFNFDLSRDDYEISMELVIFRFKPGRQKGSISLLNRRVHDNALAPLIYINNNIFNNYIAFNPDVMRSKSSGAMLPQMIGRVSVKSQSRDLEFNSDRTNFVSNDFSNALLKDLENLNIQIQSRCSKIKKDLITGRAKPHSDDITQKIKTSCIHIEKNAENKFDIPSSQIFLEDYISKVINSKGESVDKNSVKITVDGENLNGNVLSSVEESCEKKILFKYYDENTGVSTKELTLFFEEKKSNITGEAEKNSLFKIRSVSEYKIKLETVSCLIYGINKAYSSKDRNAFMPLIACSIRSMFEISSEAVFKKNNSWFEEKDKISGIEKNIKGKVNDTITFRVVSIFILVKNNNRLLSRISEILDINFSTFKNLLDVNKIINSVKLSHVGAHRSTQYLNKSKIEMCAEDCGIFVAICDAILSINNTDSLNVKKIEGLDFNNFISSIL